MKTDILSALHKWVAAPTLRWRVTPEDPLTLAPEGVVLEQEWRDLYTGASDWRGVPTVVADDDE